MTDYTQNLLKRYKEKYKKPGMVNGKPTEHFFDMIVQLLKYHEGKEVEKSLDVAMAEKKHIEHMNDFLKLLGKDFHTKSEESVYA